MDPPALSYLIQWLRAQTGDSSRSESRCWESLALIQISSQGSFPPPCLVPAQTVRHSKCFALVLPRFHGDKTHMYIRGLLKAWESGNGGKLHCLKMENTAALLWIPPGDRGSLPALSTLPSSLPPRPPTRPASASLPLPPPPPPSSTGLQPPGATSSRCPGPF